MQRYCTSVAPWSLGTDCCFNANFMGRPKKLLLCYQLKRTSNRNLLKLLFCVPMSWYLKRTVKNLETTKKLQLSLMWNLLWKRECFSIKGIQSLSLWDFEGVNPVRRFDKMFGRKNCSSYQWTKGDKVINCCCISWWVCPYSQNCVSIQQWEKASSVTHFAKTPLCLSSKKEERECFYCHKPGHLISNCLSLKRRQQSVSNTSQPKGVVLIRADPASVSPLPIKCQKVVFNRIFDFH